MAKDINKYQNDLNLVRNRIIETNKLLRPNKQTTTTTATTTKTSQTFIGVQLIAALHQPAFAGSKFTVNFEDMPRSSVSVVNFEHVIVDQDSNAPRQSNPRNAIS